MTDLTLEAAPPSCAPASVPLVAALQALYRAFQKSSIYPSGHPSIPEAVGRALRELEGILAGQPTVLVGVARDQLLYADQRLSEATGSLRSLALLLHQLDVAALEFGAGLTSRELEVLVEVLGRARREKIKGGSLVDALDQAGVGRVRLCPIDYRALRFAEGSAGERDDDDGTGWAEVTRLLTDPTTYATEGAAADLALAVSQQIEQQEGAGVGALRRQVHEALSEAGALRADQRQVVRRRLSGFLAGLNEGLRADLLRVDTARPRSSMALLAEIAEELPVAELLQALADVDRAGGRVPDEMLSLVNKLARISERRPQDAGGLRATLARWGVSLPAPHGLDETRADYAELLHRRSDAEYNPAAYRGLLADLSRDDIPGIVQASALRYRDPTDPVDVRLHAAQVAVQLLERPEGDAHRKNLLAYVQEATAFLLDQESYGTVHDAALAARAHCLLKTDSDETRRAARGFLAEFTRAARIDAILIPARRGQVPPDDAMRLLALGGSEALDRVFDLLAERLAPNVARALMEFARERGSDLIGRVLEARAARGPAALDPVLALLRELPEGEALPLAERLAHHADARVRREALALLCTIDDRPGSPELHLRRALCDPDETVVGLGVQRLGERQSGEALELLGAYLEGGLLDVVPSTACGRRAAQQLLDRGEPGRARLCRSLDTLLRKPRPCWARQAHSIAGLLLPERSDPLVRRALRHWRFSLARTLTLIWRAGETRT